MPFDLESATPAFDLASAKPAGDEAASPKRLNFGAAVADAVAGPGEANASLLTGSVAAPVAGLTGIAAAFAKRLGITDAEAGDIVRKVQEHFTYQPRSQTGQDMVGAVAAPFEALARGANTAGENVTDTTGSPLLGAATNTTIQSVPLVLGKVAGKIGGKLGTAEGSAATGRAATAIDQAPARANIQAARDAGYVLTPVEAKAGVTTRSVEGLAGSAKLQKAASAKNQPNTNRLIRDDIGLDPETEVSPKAIQTIIDDAHKPYEAIKKIGPFSNDEQYFSDLDQITKSRDTAAESYSHRKTPTADEARFQDAVVGLRKAANPTTASAVEEVKLLRSDAKRAFRGGDDKLGIQYRALAETVDGAMERALQRASTTGDLSGDPTMANAVSAYRAARVRIAKAYQAQDALGPDGNFDANVYGNIAKRSPDLLTGPAKQVGDFAQQFPSLAQRAQRIGHTGMDFGDLALMAFRAARGAAGDALLLGARPAARAALLSSPMQKAIASPPSYGRSMSSRAAQLTADIQASPLAGVTEMSAAQRQQRAAELLEQQ